MQNKTLQDFLKDKKRVLLSLNRAYLKLKNAKGRSRGGLIKWIKICKAALAETPINIEKNSCNKIQKIIAKVACGAGLAIKNAKKLMELSLKRLKVKEKEPKMPKKLKPPMRLTNFIAGNSPP